MSPRRIVIVGGMVAGTSAAAAARREDPDCEILILEHAPHASYIFDGIPYKLADRNGQMEDLVVALPAEFWADRRVEMRTHHHAIGLDVEHRLLKVEDLRHQRQYDLEYDALIIATGAESRVPDIPGSEMPEVFPLRTIEDGIAVHCFLNEARPQTAVVVGSGSNALATVHALRMRGIAVTLICDTARPLTNFHPAISRVVSEELENHHVRVKTSSHVERIEPGATEHCLAIHTDTGAVAGEMVIFTTARAPEVSLAKSAGLALSYCGPIQVDAGMHTSVPGVFAAGACAVTYHRAARRHVFTTNPAVSEKQGEIAGRNAAGANRTFAGTVGTRALQVFSLEVARTGLTLDDIAHDKLDVVETVSSQTEHSRGLSSNPLITSVVYANREDGLLVGAEMVGRGTVAKRIDVFATALYAGLTVEDLPSLDLSFSPPLSPLTDPVLVAGNAACDALHSEGVEISPTVSTDVDTEDRGFDSDI